MQLYVEAGRGDPAYSVEVDDELLDIDVGPKAEEEVRLLADTRAYRHATDALGGEPTALLDAASVADRLPLLRNVRYIAARDAARGRQRVVIALAP